MNIYLIQHGEAMSEELNPERPLTEKGKSDVSKTAAFMKKAGVKIDEIWQSTKLRAKQTAEIAAQTLGIKNVIEKEGLAPNDPVAPVADMINKSNKNIVIAGHLPFLSKLTSLLINGSESREVVKFKQGGVVALERTDSGYLISWMIVP